MSPEPNLTDLRRELREAATRPHSALRIIEGAEWKVLIDNYEKGTLFIGHVSKLGGVDVLVDGITDAALAEYIAKANPSNILALLDLLDRIEQYADHKPECIMWGRPQMAYKGCSCGFLALLAPTQGGN